MPQFTGVMPSGGMGYQASQDMFGQAAGEGYLTLSHACLRVVCAGSYIDPRPSSADLAARLGEQLMLSGRGGQQQAMQYGVAPRMGMGAPAPGGSLYFQMQQPMARAPLGHHQVGYCKILAGINVRCARPHVLVPVFCRHLWGRSHPR